MNPSDFNIIRDSRYHTVYRRDRQRQRVRRMTRRLGAWYEQAFKWPIWRKPIETARFSGKRPSLSVCIMTMNAAGRIRPLLEYIRPFAGEIVVGVDGKTTDDTLAVCQGLADELFVIPSDALTCNAGLETLVSHCHGDWVLRLDDDEFPEPHFAELVAGAIADARYTHYKLPRLHLCNIEPFQWINDDYLYPDFQMRLFRNDPALLTFPGAVGHRGIECAGRKGRMNTVNLVHLNLAINPRFKREEKLETYIRRLNGGWVHPINEHALLFENFRYRIEPYQYPNAAFLHRLAETVRHQRALYEDKQP